MGWNEAKSIKSSKLFKGINKDSIFYFLHSFYFKCKEEDNTIAISEYGISFSSAINSKNIYGIQFHPEKSHNNGEKLLKNFALI
jgi:glutamine amidotransferase